MLAAVGLAAVAGLAVGCSSSSSHTDPNVLLQKAKTTLDSTSSLHFKLGSTNVSLQSTNLIGGEGDLVRPDQIQGTFTVSVSGFTANVKVIAKNGVFAAQLPFTNHYTKTDPTKFGLTDPTLLIDPNKGLSNLLTLAQNPTKGPSIRIGGELLETVSYTVPGSEIPVLPDADPSKPVDITVAINPSNYQLRTVKLTGPLTSSTSNSTYALTLTNYNEQVNITLPPLS